MNTRTSELSRDRQGAVMQSPGRHTTPSAACVVVLWLVVVVSLSFAQKPAVEKAWDLVARGERDQAVRLLQQIIASNPRDADARLLLGSIFADAGKLPQAIAHLKEAVRLRPRSAQAHHALGEALRSNEDTDAARNEFEAAVKLDPAFAQAHADLGLILLEAGESAAAAKHLDRAIAIFGRKPESAYPRYLRAKIHSEDTEVEKAAAELSIAVSLEPEFAEAWSDLGQARKALSDDPGALAAFERAVALNPKGAIARYRLGAEYFKQGNTKKAVVHLEEALRLNPDDQSTLYALQQALRQEGRLEEARAIAKRLAQVLRNIDNESQNAFNALKLNNDGARLEKDGNLRAALDRYRAAVALDPNHVGIRANFAVALLRSGEWADGLSQMREALRRDPGNAQIKAALADALEQAPVEFGGKGKRPNTPK